MGFLDRLVSDMIGESVGFNPRRLIRMVGGKNLLMIGAGAALAGGVASAASRGGERPSGPSPSQLTGAPPPPPPGPVIPPPPPPPAASAAASVPPPPPGEPVAGEDAEPPKETTYAIVRAMVAAALADGHLEPREKEMIQGRLGESGLSEDQVRQIHQDLVLPPTPAEVAALVPPGEAREHLYRFAALIVLADGQASDLERGWLDRLARASEIAGERVAELEKEIFAT